MSNARNLARLLPNASGQLPDANLAAIAAGKLSGQIQKANANSGSVLQAVQVSNNTKTASTVSGVLMSASITPTFSTSKILILVSMALGQNNMNGALQVRRNGTLVGTVASTAYVSGSNGFNTADDNVGGAGSYSIANHCYNTSDSPNSTSSLTYDLYYQAPLSNGDIYFNRQNSDNGGASVSTITLIEVAA